MLKPSHALHIDGLAPSPPFHGNMRRNRIPVPSSAGLTEPSIGAKYVGRTVSMSAASGFFIERLDGAGAGTAR
jgi:hypothetical protein